MTVRSETVYVKKIISGYTIERSDGNYTRDHMEAFTTWDALIDNLKANPPRMFSVKYNKETGDNDVELVS